MEMYAQVTDPDIKRQIEVEISVLRGEADAEAMRRTDQELSEAHRRDFPYMPTTLYLLVGSRPLVDPNAPYLETNELVMDEEREEELEEEPAPETGEDEGL